MTATERPATPPSSQGDVAGARPKPCGTYAAYARHKRRGEEPCQDCITALRARSNTRNARHAAAAPMGDCLGCGERRPIRARGWCWACYGRWQRAGKPADGPPPLLTPDELRAVRARAAEQARAIRALHQAIRRGGWEWAA